MRYCIKELIDPMHYKYDKHDAIRAAKYRMADLMALEIINNHVSLQPKIDPETGERVITLDMEIVGSEDAATLRRQAKIWAYQEARQDLKREIAYGMAPDEQDVV